LITRLPNIFEKNVAFSDFKNTVTILSGTHGVGTAATRLLFDREDLLSEINRRAKQYEFWQALITINGMRQKMHPVSKTLRQVAISLATNIEFEPVRI
jgi:hypothetical protein